ncbi:MAG: SDR family NAD(P)-dependent oxidoreductase [Promethearchaeota archaeon]
MLNGKNVLITGSGRGIGKSLALGFAKLDANIILTSRTKEQIEEVKSQIEKIGQKAIAIVADVKIYDDIKNVVDKAIENFGKIDVLINNAGFSKIKPITRLRVQEFQDMIDINVKGVYNATHAVVPHMIEQKEGGSIINTGSLAVNMALPGWSCYAMTKSALLSFTTCLAEELKKYKIRVNTIMPNMVHTPMLHAGRTPEQIQSLNAMQPEELVPYFAFFASDKSNRVTGQNINIEVMEKIIKIAEDLPEEEKTELSWKKIANIAESQLSINEFRMAKKNKKLVNFLLEWNKK